MVENIETIETKEEKWFRESYKELNKNNPFKDINFFPIRMIDFTHGSGKTFTQALKKFNKE